jgi:hypothetical protein
MLVAIRCLLPPVSDSQSAQLQRLTGMAGIRQTMIFHNMDELQ